MVTCYRTGEVTPLRIDAWYYKPEFIAMQHATEASGKCASIGQLIDSDHGIAGGATPLGAEYSEGRVRFYRTSEVHDCMVDPYSAVRLSDEQDETLSRSRLAEGDVLLTITGADFGHAGAVGRVHLPGNISQHSVRLRIEQTDAHYLVAYLECKYGQAAIWRNVYGATRPAIDYPGVRSIVVRVPETPVQTYIGDKVRQAERLRVRAREQISNAEMLFNSAVAWSAELERRPKYRRIDPSQIEGRLDGNFNSPQRILLLEHIRRHSIPIDTLSEITNISAMIGWKGLTTEYYTEHGPWLLRGVEFKEGVIEFNELVSIDQDKFDEQPQIHLKEGDVALTKDGTIGKAIVVPKLSNQMAAGSTVARLRPLHKCKLGKAPIDPYYLEYAINHQFLQIQVGSFATGLAQPHITQEWIARLQIPRCASEAQIVSEVRKHHEMLTTAILLTESAKYLVEALIDGKVGEDELKAAQEALERGDTSLDRAMLQRMTRKGMDVVGEPALFLDLDALYTTLAEVASAEPVVAGAEG